MTLHQGIELYNVAEMLVHLDGRRLLKDLANLTGDATHLAPAGMEEVSVNLARVIKARAGIGAA